MVVENELQTILCRGGRGTNAKRVAVPGDGLGLFLVDTLAKTANAKLSVRSSAHTQLSLDGVPYSDFRAVLDFHKTGV